MDSATGAAWLAAAIATASAVVAAVQAKHAKASAVSARSQAESAERQAQAAEDEVVLTRLKMLTGGDEARALQMFEARREVVRYLGVASELIVNSATLWFTSPDTRRGAESYGRTSARIANLTTRLHEHFSRYAGLESEESVRRVMNEYSPKIRIALSALSGTSSVGITARVESALSLCDEIRSVVADPRRFDK